MAKRMDLEGLRFRMPGDDTVWLIDQGQKRGIVYAAYVAVFRNWDNIHLDIDIGAIESGPSLDGNTCLFRCYDDGRVFLLDGQKKRHVLSQAVMDRFQFDSSKIHVWNVSIHTIGIPDGVDLTKTGRPD